MNFFCFWVICYDIIIILKDICLFFFVCAIQLSNLKICIIILFFYVLNYLISYLFVFNIWCFKLHLNDIILLLFGFSFVTHKCNRKIINIYKVWTILFMNSFTKETLFFVYHSYTKERIVFIFDFCYVCISFWCFP